MRTLNPWLWFQLPESYSDNPCIHAKNSRCKVSWLKSKRGTNRWTDRRTGASTRSKYMKWTDMASAEREPITGVWRRSRVDRPPPTSPPPGKNSSDLYQFRERPLAKVGWTCPPQSTRISLSSLLAWSVIIISRTEWFGNCKWVVDTDWLTVVPGCRDLTRVPRVHCQAARGALRQRRWAGSSPTVPRAAWTAVHPSTCQTENALNRRRLKQHQHFKYASK